LPVAAGERPDLERAYFQLICMRAVQARLDTSDDAAARTEMLADQAWVAVEVSTMTPDRIERLHAAAEAQSLEFEAFHQCITARLPE